MVKSKNVLLAAILLLTATGVVAQGNLHLSQGVFGQAFINPAYAGSNGELFHATGAIRSELGGFEGSPTTTLINVNGGFAALKGGLGLTVANEKIGQFGMPSFSFAYAFRFPVWSGSVSLGLSAGLLNSSLDPAGWRTPDGGSLDPGIPSDDKSIISPDFGFGTYFDRDDFFIGLSVMHLTKVKITKADKAASLPRMLHITGGYRYYFDNPSYVLLPSAYISTDFAVAHYTLGAHLAYKNKLIGGLSYRHREAVVLMFGFEPFKDIKISYSYDFVTSNARLGGNGAHELLMSYSFSVSTDNKRKQYRSIRYL